MNDCGIKNRNSVVHAVKVLCDCWGLWKKTRGKKGQASSVFVVAGIGNHDIAMARIILTEDIYGTYCPTRDQLKDKPPEKFLYDTALAAGTTKYGPEWWVAKALQLYPEDTSSSIPKIPVEVSL